MRRSVHAHLFLPNAARQTFSTVTAERKMFSEGLIPPRAFKEGQNPLLSGSEAKEQSSPG